MRGRSSTLLSIAVALLAPLGARAASTSANFGITVVAAPKIAAVSLSNNTFSGGAPPGTVVGSIAVTMSPASPGFSGILSLGGPNAASFQIVGSNLVTTGTDLAGTYGVNIIATQSGAGGSPFVASETITGISATSACIGQTYTYNFVSSFGAVSGGSVATNNAALQAFNVEAQRRTRPAEPGYSGGANAAGNPYAAASKDNCIVLSIPAGSYQYSWNHFAEKIGHLKIIGAGSMTTNLQNINNDGSLYDEQPFFSNMDYFGAPAGPNPYSYGYLINTANVGDTSVTLANNPANAAQFYPGRWVLIWSYTQQYQNYPPNARYYDWAKVISANAMTGIIVIDTPLTFQHRSDRPYSGVLADGPKGTWGPARITPIDTPASPVAVYQEVDGVHFLTNPNWNLNSAAGPQLTAGCVEFTGIIDGLVNDVVADNCIVMSQLRDFTFSNSRWAFDEADKIIRTLTYLDDTVGSASVSGSGTYNHAGELWWHVIGGTITNYRAGCCGPGLSIGARNVILEGGLLLDGMSVPGGDYNHGIMLDDDWQTLAVTVNGVTFRGDDNLNNRPLNGPQLLYQTVDGTVVSVTSGPNGPNTRLRVQQKLATYGSPSERINDDWGDGAPIWKNGNWIAGAVVTSITGDGNYLYVDVNGTTFTVGDRVWAAKIAKLTVQGVIGQNTGYTWGAPNLIYPNGANSVPTIVWSNNSGN